VICPVSDQPPANLTAHSTSSTSIEITWDLIPPHEKYIATRAYHVTMVRADHFSDTEQLNAILSACVNATNMTLHRTKLRKYTAYRITVAGVTDRGIGKASDEITVLTDEDGKSTTTKCVIGHNIKTQVTLYTKKVKYAYEPSGPSGQSLSRFL